MFELGLVAAAISSIIDYPVKTFDECVANGIEVLPNQILDLDIVHKYSFVRQDDDRPVQEPSFTQDFEIVGEGDEGDNFSRSDLGETCISEKRAPVAVGATCPPTASQFNQNTRNGTPATSDDAKPTPKSRTRIV